MKNTPKSVNSTSLNSFYHLGGIEILSMQQDEISKLWKIYLSTTEHYLVSREFDRSVGLYANAPDNIVRQGLMEFSDSLLGCQFSLWKTMDLFIDRCFDNNVFDGYTENAVWMSFDYPSYSQVEDIIGTYNCRLKWFDQSSEFGKLISDATVKTLVGDDKRKLIEGLKNGFAENKITSVFMNHDTISEKLISDRDFEDIPVFMGEFSDNEDFIKFNYLKR